MLACHVIDRGVAFLEYRRLRRERQRERGGGEGDRERQRDKNNRDDGERHRETKIERGRSVVDSDRIQTRRLERKEGKG